MIGRSAFIFASRVIGAGITFATQILLARWMGASELGIYVLAFSWCLMLATLSVGGLQIAAVRFVGAGLAARDHGVIRGFIISSRRVVLLISLLFIALLLGLLLISGDRLWPGPHLPAFIALATIPVLAQMNLLAGISQAFKYFAVGVLPGQVLRPLFFFLVVAALWYLGIEADASMAMAAQWVIILVITLGASFALRQITNSTLEGAAPSYDTKLWLKTALPLIAMSLFNVYFAELMVILSGMYLPSDELAVFHVSYRIALLISFVLYAVDTTIGPDAARLYAAGELDKLQAMVRKAAQLRFWAALAALIGMAAIGKWLLMLFGDEFVHGYQALLILAAAQLVKATAGPVNRLISISGHQNRSIVVFGTTLVAAVVIVGTLVPAWGLTGAAVSALLCITLWCVWMRQIVIRHLGIKPSII